MSKVIASVFIHLFEKFYQVSPLSFLLKFVSLIIFTLFAFIVDFKQVLAWWVENLNFLTFCAHMFKWHNFLSGIIIISAAFTVTQVLKWFILIFVIFSKLSLKIWDWWANLKNILCRVTRQIENFISVLLQDLKLTN